MRSILCTACLALACVVSWPVAALEIFACEPEWGALSQELGGKDVSVSVATTARQDVHHIEARPSLIARVRRADLVVCTGAELEAGWLPMLLRQAANSRVQPGRPGYFAAADHVEKLGVPARLDRAMGDVHAQGNPHIHGDPRRIGAVAKALAQRLGELDAASKDVYYRRYQDFAARWQQAIARWEAQAAPLRGAAVVSHHRDWVYLYDWLGMDEVATLEPKPGIAPSAGHLGGLLAQLKSRPAKMIIYAAYQDPRPSTWLSERAGIPAVMLPYSVGGTGEARDLFGLFDDTLRRLLHALK